MTFNPFKPFFACYFQIIDQGGKALIPVMTGLVLGWWLYVPVHELFHAFGCILTGGDVTELEINALYGGNFLGKLFSFVTAEGDYAGRLTGFDTKGSDWIYGATIFAPYLLTLPSYIIIKKAAAKNRPLLFGLLLPVFFAPVISITGDFYELGSLLAYHIRPGPDSAHRLLISDDLFRLIGHTRSGGGDIVLNGPTVSFMTLSSILSLVLIWCTLMLSISLGRYWKVAV